MISLHQLPLLFLTQSSRSCKEGETTVGVYSVAQNKTYKLKSFVPRWFGSSHGWLISVDYENGAITISNPFFSKVK
jgi:hypothetical protein